MYTRYGIPQPNETRAQRTQRQQKQREIDTEITDHRRRILEACDAAIQKYEDKADAGEDTESGDYSTARQDMGRLVSRTIDYIIDEIHAPYLAPPTTRIQGRIVRLAKAPRFRLLYIYLSASLRQNAWRPLFDRVAYTFLGAGRPLIDVHGILAHDPAR